MQILSGSRIPPVFVTHLGEAAAVESDHVLRWGQGKQHAMVGDEASTAGVPNRLRRAQGQLAGVISMIEADRECRERGTAAGCGITRTGPGRLQDRGHQHSGMGDGSAADGGQPISEIQLEKLFLVLA